MEWFPLYNSLRIALISTTIVFFFGIFMANWVAKQRPMVKGFFDAILLLPLVLPPTVVGWLLLMVLSPNRPLGALFGGGLTMTWWSAIFATIAVSFPLFYRTVRGSFEAMDVTVLQAGRTLGLSDRFLFWQVQLPMCKQGILAGLVLAFARALGEYGATAMVAGYTPNRTATIATTVYQLWRTGEDGQAWAWVGVNMAIALVFLLALQWIEHRRETL
ncbi:molybdate ABC transporter permease subunit [Bengtsoniella intestinalis]|uniref:molybdate ABC transporter permease subunit n=1 Tax=Bengtsoniella intestinalis TaxID=3073143 RepID=UPI00391F9FD2